MIAENGFISVEKNGASALVSFTGAWTIENAGRIDQLFSSVIADCRGGAVIDCSDISDLDTTGAVLIRRFAKEIEEVGAAVLTGMRLQHKKLMDVVMTRPPPAATAPDTLVWYLKPLHELGETTNEALLSAGNLLGFIGLVLARFIGSIIAPSRIRFVSLVHQMEVTGLNAMGIVGLISFLIGAVMVNQGAVQLAKFGADIFVIDMLGISHLRELGILLTAIIVAGRSGSAFTAQIGSMRLREEIDAMKTLGMNPIDVLVLPRMIALIVCLPLLGFYADIVGVTGGMLMAWVQLDISPANFLVYFRDVMTLDHFMVGILKAPFFAAIIAICGCYQGLQVAGSADSLGQHTTRSVVQAIFLVIVFDAFFAVFFTAIGL